MLLETNTLPFVILSICEVDVMHGSELKIIYADKNVYSNISHQLRLLSAYKKLNTNQVFIFTTHY